MDMYIPWRGWNVVRTIGRGSFGTVYEIRKETYGTVEKAAMKVISVPESNERLDDLYGSGLDDESVSTWCSKRIEDFLREYNVMSRLKGKTNIVSCEDVDVVPHENDPGATIYIRMELLTSLTKLLSLISKREEALSEEEKETLRKLRPDHKEFTEKDVIKIGKDITQALELCEKSNFIHRDIKPENILVTGDGDYKLGDFGTARKMEHTMAATFAGTERYMAPEVIKGGKTGTDVDTYALGLVMYRLLNRGRLPFYPLTGIPTAEQVEDAQRKRLEGEAFDPPVDGSPELKALVMKACSYDRNNRFKSAAEMRARIIEAEEIMLGKSNEGSREEILATAHQDNMEDIVWDDDSDKTLGIKPVVPIVADEESESEASAAVSETSSDGPQIVEEIKPDGEKAGETTQPPKEQVEQKHTEKKDSKKIASTSDNKKNWLNGKISSIEKGIYIGLMIFAIGFFVILYLSQPWNTGMLGFVITPIIGAVFVYFGLFAQKKPSFSKAMALIGSGIVGATCGDALRTFLYIFLYMYNLDNNGAWVLFAMIFLIIEVVLGLRWFNSKESEQK